MWKINDRTWNEFSKGDALSYLLSNAEDRKPLSLYWVIEGHDPILKSVATVLNNKIIVVSRTYITVEPINGVGLRQIYSSNQAQFRMWRDTVERAIGLTPLENLQTK